MKLQSNMLLAADIRPSILFIYDDKLVFHGNVGVLGGQEVILNYDQVAQVNQHRGVIEGNLEIVNSGGRNTFAIDHVTNDDADKAKMIIDERANLARGNAVSVPPPPPPIDPPTVDTGIELLDDLAKLKDQGILTEAEFEEKKRQILDRI